MSNMLNRLKFKDTRLDSIHAAMYGGEAAGRHRRFFYPHFLLVFVFSFLAAAFCSAAPAEFSPSDFYQKLADSAQTLTRQRVLYDPAYYRLDYPGGDVPQNRGVCTDVVIRAYRKMNVDLQKEVHEDMEKNFAVYPKNWGLKKTDRNIDHRRVPNLMVFFARHGTELKKTTDAKDYLPGDIVAWDLGKGVTHIGVVSNQKSADGVRYKIVHNIGMGQVLEDRLFDFKIIGHYRYQKN